MSELESLRLAWVAAVMDLATPGATGDAARIARRRYTAARRTPTERKTP
jgi:hypothetical protein